jgi:hypothetical protein
MRRFTLVVVLLCAVATAPTASAVIGGQADGNAHPYVVFVGDPVTRASCTATLISPTLGVTAAHCFPPGTTVLVFPYAEGPRGGPPVMGQFIPHPDFCKPPACDGQGGIEDFVTDDVAVIRLSEPVSLPRYAELPKLERSQGKGAVQKHVGKDVELLGFGVQAFVPQPVSDLTRQVASERVAQPDPVVAEKYVQVDQDAAGFCLGDSGGPLIEKKKDVVLAISSFVYEDTTCLGPSYSYRLDSATALGFIRSFQ